MKPMMLMLLSCLCLCGCGQKGPLYQTPVPETNKASTQQVQSPNENAETTQSTASK
ncbi:LPS translocon maturation chaperone LptM [Parashewanella curva]|uniref:LPS translocon maturation chaperone LptM n=1 Tax=Parashewanella curva TaxID=2338552 RepID=UPI00269A53F5